MTPTRNPPGLNETQAWERSAAANPRSRGDIRAVARREEIRAGDGNKADATQQSSIAYPRREVPNIV
jgi:hypothetical protein